jgi:hypothetical protein
LRIVLSESGIFRLSFDSFNSIWRNQINGSSTQEGTIKCYLPSLTLFSEQQLSTQQSQIGQILDPAMSGKDINTIKSQIEGKYMNRRIFSQKFKDTISMQKLNSSNKEMPQMEYQMGWKCKKFMAIEQCDFCKHVLPPVNSTFYNNKNQRDVREMKESMKSPNVRMTRDYFHSQKHMSEKFQQVLYIEKSKNDQLYGSQFDDSKGKY